MKTKNKKTNNKLSTTLLTIATVIISSSVSAAPPIYDNFKGSTLNANRWYGGSVNRYWTEYVSEIVDKSYLHMRIRGVSPEVGETTGDIQRVTGRLHLREDNGVIDVDSIRSIQLYARVNVARTQDCNTTSAPLSRGRFRSFDQWFNDGSSTGDTDATGNIWSTLGPRRDNNNQANELNVSAVVFRCNDADCLDVTELFNDGDDPQLNGFGFIRRGHNVLYRTTWDEPTQQIRFLVKPRGEPARIATFDYSGTIAAAGPSITTEGFPKHTLRIRSEAADCDVEGTGSARPFGLMDMTVWNVRVADTAVGN